MQNLLDKALGIASEIKYWGNARAFFGRATFIDLFYLPPKLRSMGGQKSFYASRSKEEKEDALLHSYA